MRRSAVDAEMRPAKPHGSARRKAVAVAAVAAVVLGAAYAIYRERYAFAAALQRVGVWPMLLSLAVGAAGVAATFPLWREVLGGLGVWLPWGQGARVFFTSQLGKYLPGSVWPVVIQMEAGRAHGASRRTMLAGSLLTIVLSCCVGLLVACIALPVWSAHALAHYWWVLLALPFLLALLHPRALPALLDRVFALVGREPLNERLPLRSTVRAGAWSALSWLLLGTHVYVLCAALGHAGLSAFALSLGGMALAVSAGVLLIPVPAGAGLREVVLLLVLRSILSYGQSLVVVIASRALLIVADLLLAAVAAAPRAVRATLSRSRRSAL